MNNTPKVSGIRRTECMTYPRSGHHLLEGLLRPIYGSDFHYSEFYEDDRHLDTHPETNVQKNHDFGLTARNDKDDRQYIVQVRTPIESLTSYYLFEYRNQEKTKASWEAFAMTQAVVWADFYTKWVVEPCPRPRLVLKYSDLVWKPRETLARVAEFLTGLGLTEMQIDNALEVYPIQEPSQPKYLSFPFHSPEFTRDIETAIVLRLLDKGVIPWK